MKNLETIFGLTFIVSYCCIILPRVLFAPGVKLCLWQCDTLGQVTAQLDSDRWQNKLWQDTGPRYDTILISNSESNSEIIANLQMYLPFNVQS